MNYKIGDKVEVKRFYLGNSRPQGYIGIITSISTGTDPILYLDNGNGVYTNSVELINNITNMNILEQIKLARKSEPEKTLVKAGLMNMDESLTTEGTQVLNDILVQEYKAKMKTTADIIIAEKEKENKK